MNAPLLLTKFYMPVLQEVFVPRKHLLEQLSSPQKLTLISAPAGFGKTTLAVYWLTNQDHAVAWFSIDESDNDPRQFFTYLITALNRIDPAIGQTSLDKLHSQYPPIKPDLLSHFINDITQSEQKLILALDDYHLIEEYQIHDALIFLLENLPQQLHLVITSRIEPPLPIAKFRAKNQITELHSDVLRFNRSEIDFFLNKTMKLDLSEEDITQLENQTEGWITGLQLAALSLKKTSDAASFIRHLSDNDPYIKEYLVNEVISNQTAGIQQFLLGTSILRRMNSELCNDLLGISDSQAILESLEKSNLFVSPLDQNRGWYRYHHLFAKMLQNRLEEKNPDHMVSLHRSAASWFLSNNMVSESIEHSLRAKDYKIVIEHIDANIDQIMAQGAFGKYLKWLGKIPKKHQTPSIALYQLFLLHEMGEFNAYKKQLIFVEKMLGSLPGDTSDLAPEIKGHFGVLSMIKGIRAASNFSIDEAAIQFRQALQLLPRDMAFWRIMVQGAEGFFHYVNGNYSKSIDIYSKIIVIAANSNHLFISFMNSIALAKIYLESGQLTNALHTCRTLLKRYEKEETKIRFAGLAYMVMGQLLFYTGDLLLSEKYIKQGINQVVQDGDAFSTTSGYFTLAQIYFAQNNSDIALIKMQEMQEAIRQLPPSQTVQKIADSYEAHIRIMTNNKEQARAWAAQPGFDYLEKKQFPDLVGLPYLGVYRTGQKPLIDYADNIRLLTAIFAIADDQEHEAIFTLDNLLAKTEQTEKVLFRCRILIHKAIALQKIGKTEKAVSSLISAIELVAPEPFFQLFISEGQTIQHLLERAQIQLLASENSFEPNIPNSEISQFIAQLLAKIPSSYSMNTNKRPHFVLTPREIDVLHCIAEGLTYSKGAERLHVTMNTFKTHIKHIYGKLDVSNSTQAINKAKKLNLLSFSHS